MKKLLSLFTMLLTAVAVMATDYTDKLSVTNNISGNVPEDYAITKTLDAQTISVEEGTDGVYTFTLDLRSDPDVSEILVFAAPVTENADGTISFACEKVASPLTQEVWTSYSAYITAHGKIYDGKLYAYIFADWGGFAADYPDQGYDYTFVFGTDPDGETAISTVKTNSEVTAVYNANGMKVKGLQRGLNIVRTADGKTKKVLN